MELSTYIKSLRQGDPTIALPTNAGSLEFAQMLDSQDRLGDLRDEFIIPNKASLAKGQPDGVRSEAEVSWEECVYLTAHGQGLQPKVVDKYVRAQLKTWASLGVRGHFMEAEDSPLKPWQDMAENCAKRLAGIVGALESEVAVMNGLSVNLHLMMATFYRPTMKRHKVLMELGPFPSDQFVVESQIKWHGKHKPEESIIKISPENTSADIVTTEQILRVIDDHADETALLLLPGVHYYTGQHFNIPAITAHAKAHGIIVGWDLAHAIGNVELKLHEWGIDFAVWCHYKYLNAGPGSIAGGFVHDMHGNTDLDDRMGIPRLAGWYGSSLASRYDRKKQEFTPSAGAAGFQISNPSAMDLAILSAALSVFCKKPMHEMRSKSMALGGYAEYLLGQMLEEAQVKDACTKLPFSFITPRNPHDRGAQISLQINDGKVAAAILDMLEQDGIVCDVRKSGLLRFSSSAFYTRFEDVWAFGKAMRKALKLS